MAQHGTSSSSLFPEYDHPKQTFAQEVFHHMWPIFLFGTLFLLMCSIPMILAGAMPIEGLMILVVFGLAIALGLFIPPVAPVFIFLVALSLFVIYPEGHYNKSGFWGTALFLTSFAVIGLMIAAASAFARKETVSVEKVAPVKAVAAVAAVEAVVEGPKPLKPVAFDKTIAAKGISIIVGTESGNTEGLAQMAKASLESDGHAVQILDAKVVDYRHLPAFANLLVMTSTWGDGDPPSNAIDLIEGLKAPAEPLALGGRQFSVLGMGDTSYEQFCKCGKDFDELLAKYGAKRFADRVDCDLSYEAPYAQWIASVQSSLKAGLMSVEEYTPAAELVTA